MKIIRNVLVGVVLVGGIASGGGIAAADDTVPAIPAIPSDHNEAWENAGAQDEGLGTIGVCGRSRGGSAKGCSLE